MFSDRYGLTDAVLQGRKTMTRRIIKQLLNVENPDISDWGLKDGGKAMITLYEGGRPTTDIFPMYQPGEVVAVAQSYKDLKLSYIPHIDEPNFKTITKHAPQWGNPRRMKGWNNKMYVRTDLMPHQIRITDIKVERLQDITEEDCLREGLIKRTDGFIPEEYFYTYCGADVDFAYVKTAFEDLIDKVSGKGTWERNPYVFAYSFELIK